MTLTLEEIAQQALALAPEQRAKLTDQLWESLGDTTFPPVSEEWKKEIDRRRTEVLSGKVKMIAGEEVSRKARFLAGNR